MSRAMAAKLTFDVIWGLAFFYWGRDCEGVDVLSTADVLSTGWHTDTHTHTHARTRTRAHTW